MSFGGASDGIGSQIGNFISTFHRSGDFRAIVNAIPKLTAGEVAARLPQAAAQGLVEYGPALDLKQQLELILRS
jgi:hypothetical protein